LPSAVTKSGVSGPTEYPYAFASTFCCCSDRLIRSASSRCPALRITSGAAACTAETMEETSVVAADYASAHGLKVVYDNKYPAAALATSSENASLA
jgi:hypothetical protein